jgi:hypothetical protein
VSKATILSVAAISLLKEPARDLFPGILDGCIVGEFVAKVAVVAVTAVAI